jgi:hypothetical protein
MMTSRKDDLSNGKDELDDLIKLMPGEKTKNGKNSEAVERTILELKRLKNKSFYYEMEDELEYWRDIDRLLWMVRGNYDS